MKRVLLSIILLVSTICSAFGQTITYDAGTSFQTMRGWEAVANLGQHEFMADYDNWKDEVLDAAVAMGLNRMRVELGMGIVENDGDGYGTLLSQGLNEADNPNWDTLFWGNWDAPVNDNADPNSAQSGRFHFAFVDHQIDEVVIPLKTRLAARGETLFWSVCLVNFDAPSYYKSTPTEYGELVAQTWIHINATYGFVPDALEIWLEPDNLGANDLSTSEMSQMIGHARDRIVAAGLPKPYIITPSFVDGFNSRQRYLDIKTNSATNAGYIDEISYHLYGGMNTTQRQQLYTTASADGKNTSMLEFINATHLTLYDDLVHAGVSAWQQFVLAFPGGQDGSKYFNIGSGPGFAVAMCEMAKYLEMYFKYVRYGAIRKGVTNSGSTFEGVPFVNTNGTVVVPIKATGSGTVTVQNLPAGEYGRCVTIGNGSTSPTSYNSCASNVTIGAGGSVAITFSGAGVGAVFNTQYLAAGGPTLRYYTSTAPPVGGLW